MDDHTLIEQTTQSFQRDSLTQFMRVARGKLKPERSDHRHALERTVLVREPVKPDGLDFRGLLKLISDTSFEPPSPRRKPKNFADSPAPTRDFELLAIRSKSGRWRGSVSQNQKLPIVLEKAMARLRQRVGVKET